MPATRHCVLITGPGLGRVRQRHPHSREEARRRRRRGRQTRKARRCLRSLGWWAAPARAPGRCFSPGGSDKKGRQAATGQSGVQEGFWVQVPPRDAGTCGWGLKSAEGAVCAKPGGGAPSVRPRGWAGRAALLGRSRDGTKRAGRGEQGSLQGHEAGPGRDGGGSSCHVLSVLQGTVQKANFAGPGN